MENRSGMPGCEDAQERARSVAHARAVVASRYGSPEILGVVVQCGS